MKKKTLYFITLIMVIFIVFFLFIMQENRPEIIEESYRSLKTDNLDVLIEDRKYAKELYTDIYFDGLPLFIDKDSDRLFYCVKDDASDSYDPIVSIDGNYNIAFGSDINKNLMRNNETVKAVIYDDSRYHEYELVLTNLPLINIRMFDESFHGNYQEASILIIDNKGGYDYGHYDGKVRIRGGSSSEYPKPALRIELDKLLKGDNNTDEKKYELFGLEKDNEYVLFTSNVEKDMIRNVFSTNLWYDTCAADNQFGIKAGMSYQYVEVFINDKYWGLCAIGNPISEKRNYVDLDPSSDKYLKENIFKANFFGERRALDLEQYNTYATFDIKTDLNDKNAWKPLCDYLNTLLYSNDIEELYECMDVDNALDIYLFYNMIQGWDNVWYEDGVKFRNTYLVSKADENGDIRMIYIPWDLDRSWGHEDETGEYLLDETKNYEMIMIPIENLIELGDDKISDLIAGKYYELRSSGWSDENILKMLDELEDQAYGSGAFFRDSQRWSVNEHSENSDLKDFKDYVLRRLHYFDEYVQNTYYRP